MTFREVLRMRLVIGALLMSLSLFGGLSLAGEGGGTVAGLPAAEALRLGEIMYQKGVLPSGKPMSAFVQGGIEMDGSMCSCSNCHLPSGLGSLEGGIVSPPTNGVKLYAPLRGQMDIPGPTMKRSMFNNPSRPAYTDASLARALKDGIDPAGRNMKELMPLYPLDDKDMEIMVYYLKNLSSKFSPGLTPDTIRFATIITDEVSPAEREAFLQPLQAFIRDDWNGRVKVVSDQWDAVWHPAPDAPKAFRKLELDVWILKGHPDTWEKQLGEYYRQKPVFAILGGITTGKWAPMHDFCEKNKIPCLLPVTDLPVITENNRYTIYVSKGVYQEGEAAAKYLSRVFALPPEARIVQVFRDEDRGKALAKGFSDTWGKLGTAALTTRVVAPNEKIGAEFWKKLAAAYPNAVLLLWLGPADLAGVGTLAETGNKPLVFSSTLLAGEYSALPDAIRDIAFIMHPTRLPEEESYSMTVLNNWMRFKKLPVSNVKLASHAFLLKSVFSEALYSTAGEFYREYFLDNLDASKHR
jgi:Periplasmic binding protein